MIFLLYVYFNNKFPPIHILYAHNFNKYYSVQIFNRTFAKLTQLYFQTYTAKSPHFTGTL